MKRKIGLIVGYTGTSYKGLQFNGELNTIEKAVIGVLLKNECITEQNAIDSKKIGMKSASRTDKGVHASMNLIVAKIIKEITDELQQSIANDLQNCHIHLYKIVNHPKSFCPYLKARSRIYKYFVPTFVCKEGKFEIEAELLKINDEVNKSDSLSREYNFTEESFRINDSQYDLFKKNMSKYVGAHSFHNFTTKSVKSDSRRNIIDISCNLVIIDGIEYIEVELHGQSFLLHQIRKMVAYAVLSTRYKNNDFDIAFSNESINIPKSPSEYLFLFDIKFTDYNKYKGEEYGEICVNDDEKNIFINNFIYKEVFKIENIKNWLIFLDTVLYHKNNFIYLK